MMEMYILLYGLLAIAAFLLFSSLRHRGGVKNVPPSPPSLPIIGHLHLLKPPRHLSIAALAERYGPIVFLRLGARPALIISSPEVVEEVLSMNDTTFSNHPEVEIGRIFNYDGNSLFFAPYGPHYSNLRRLAVVELLSVSRLNILSSVRAEEFFCLVRRMLRRAGEGSRGEVELKGRLLEMTYNALSTMVAGRRFYGEDVEEGDLEMANQFRVLFHEALGLVFAFNPRDFFPALGWADLMGVERRAGRVRPKWDRFLSDLLEEQRTKRKSLAAASAVAEGGEAEAKERKRTLIDVMLAMQETDPESCTDEMIKGQIQTVLTGGSDTVAETIEAMMLMLLCHPDILKKVRAEIDSNVEPGCLLQESDLPKLPYLHCVLKELLRLVPPMQGLPPRASSEDCTIRGYHVPRGTMVFVNVWGIQRDPKLWDDPMAFKPERFAGHSGSKDGFRYIPFGAGRRGCPGENLGVRMVTYAVGFFVQCFEWDPMTAEEVDLSSVLGLTQPKGKPVVARFMVRDSMIHALSKI